MVSSILGSKNKLCTVLVAKYVAVVVLFEPVMSNINFHLFFQVTECDLRNSII